ncbi:2,3-dihydroxybenzoate-AMP ligase [Mycolicibacter terrae]|uniref:2,3-dihydroxybenzoate-AMP ligase n=1 Tax=Mycolicibacter terrae TaxID=1788 RepID=A0AAD1HYS8_9MYCO|nr:AMP-binding protein [Mycolicibacter terrae]ORW96410.1 2,3-dihydroxybenzoate-AMP ligase [Mycolicibacter terrae]BBX23208.1 2,3-dihydroxybenzoate-AMP ligase [Mycolicibacter terrae]SNV66500.1 bifunctional enzyme mbtA: salicyl-AMP ligase + salicyl-S-ArCP synthetase [Mycolicibacter terrae]
MHGFVSFPAERAAAYRAAGYWRGRPLASLLDDAAQRWPDRTAVIDAGATLTYAQLDAAADRAAAALHRLGVGAGDRVLLQLPNDCTFAVTLFGLLRVGAVPVLCLPGHRSAEIGHLAAVSDAVGIVIPDATAGFDYPAMAAELGLRRVIIGDTADAPAAPRFSPDPATPALLLVSGGTTGLPKLIPRTHDDYLYNATASARLCGLSADDVYLVALPAAHNFPLACPGLLGAMSVGATTVFGTDPSPEAAFATIARHRVTVTALVPALATLWAQACDWEPQKPTTLRLLQVGGAKLAPGDAALIRKELTPGLQQVFGMAEGLLCYTRPGDAAELLDNTQGKPLCTDDEVRVVDEDGAEAQEGELLVRGPYTINGYFNAEEVNARSFSPDGFYRSGDRVRRLTNGYLEVTGRIKDAIVRGGENIAADELETQLLRHPAIRSAAAVGLPDEYLGEKVCAAIVFNGTPLTLAELNRHLDECGVATHVRVDQLVALPTLPTTAVGKIDKKAIVRQVGNATEPSSAT